MAERIISIDITHLVRAALARASEDQDGAAPDDDGDE